MPKHLLKNIEPVKSVLREKKISLFLDYDGTITPIVGRPEDAHPSYPVREVLKETLRLYPTAVISGRKLSDLIRSVGIKELVYAGNHGLEISARQFTMYFDIGKDIRKEFERLRKPLKELTQRFRGVLFEDKGLTFTVHYRLLNSRDVIFLSEQFNRIIDEPVKSGLVRFGESKKAYDIFPNVRWDKGKAVEWILDRTKFKGTFPFYFGDDVTDIDGFRAMRGKGFSVFVGGSSPDTDFYVYGPDEVKAFLRFLCRHPLPSGELFSDIF
ncbi:MAG: trehalose-phosphatase [Deltaproteobacteria bacterium]|nr:trehalose-phosphatase [Deltaproteobacteria bacterium]